MSTSPFIHRAFGACSFPIRLFVFLIIGLLFASAVSAQTALTGGLRGEITDSNGAAVSGATVKLENKSLSIKQETTTDADGRFTVLGLTPAGDYTLTVSANNFRLFNRGGVGVVSGETNAVDVQLEIAEVNAQVTVSANDGEAQVSNSPEVSQIIDQKQLRELPLLTRNVTRVALLDPQVRPINSLGAEAFRSTRIAINGRSFRETHYKLDGSTNFDALYNNAPLQSVALSSIQEFKVLTNQYSAEHGGMSGGFIVTTTKSGTDQFHSEGFLFVRPSGIQARPPLADRRLPNQFFQGGGAIGGPIFRDKTFFFADYEGARQDRGSFIDRPRPITFLSQSREHLGLVKIDHRFSDFHTATLRVNGNYGTVTNPNDTVSSLTTSAQPAQPSTASKYISQSVGVQVADTITRGNLINEFRVNYVNAVPFSSIPLTPGVVVIRQGVSTEGNGSISTARVENFQAAEQVSYQAGKHSFRFGGDFTRQKVRDLIFDQFGTYRFDTSGTLVEYEQLLGIARLRYGQTRVDGFVQDDWRIRSNLTLNLGLRYDYQSIIKDYNNFGPRLGLAYDIKGDGKTVIRGGLGIYYDQPFLHGFTQLYLLNSTSPITGTVTLRPGDPGFPTFPNSLDPRAPFPNATRDLILRGEDIRNAYSSQYSFGVQHKLFGDYIFTADVIHALSIGQILVFNRNAPSPFPRTAPGQIRSTAAADATRPFTTFAGIPVRDVLVSTNGGTASYNALNLGVSKRFAGRYSLDAHYVFSSAEDSITEDGGSSRPNEWADVVRAERAPSDFNQRHRFTAYGTVALPFNSQFSLNMLLASGLRINPLTGVDNNGDGTLADRPAGFRRNIFEGSRQTRFDVSYLKNFAMKSINETARLELRVEVFNLFNNSNFYRFNNVYGNGATPLPTFGQPVGGISNVDPGRQIQFAARFVF